MADLTGFGGTHPVTYRVDPPSDDAMNRFLVVNVRLLAARQRDDDAAEESLLSELDSFYRTLSEEETTICEDIMTDALLWGAYCVASWPEEGPRERLKTDAKPVVKLPEQDVADALAVLDVLAENAGVERIAMGLRRARKTLANAVYTVDPDLIIDKALGMTAQKLAGLLHLKQHAGNPEWTVGMYDDSGVQWSVLEEAAAKLCLTALKPKVSND